MDEEYFRHEFFRTAYADPTPGRRGRDLGTLLRDVRDTARRDEPAFRRRFGCAPVLWMIDSNASVPPGGWGDAGIDDLLRTTPGVDELFSLLTPPAVAAGMLRRVGWCGDLA